MSDPALVLAPAGGSVADLDAGPLHYATPDGYRAEVMRSATAAGRLTVKVHPLAGGPDYLRADSVAEALEAADARIRAWRQGEPVHASRVPKPAVA